MSLPEAAQQALAALQGWDALSDYELAGTQEAVTALREADEAGRFALTALQRALAEGRLAEPAEPITLFAWEDDYEYSVWGELRPVGNNLYERVEK